MIYDSDDEKKEENEQNKEVGENNENKEEKEPPKFILEIKAEEKKEESEVFIPKDKNDELKYWDTSIDILKQRINQVHNEEHKKEYNDKLNCIFVPFCSIL